MLLKIIINLKLYKTFIISFETFSKIFANFILKFIKLILKFQYSINLK